MNNANTSSIKARAAKRSSILALAALLLVCLAAPAPLLAGTPSWRKAEEGTCQVTRFVFARKVQDRQPLEISQVPPADGGRVYAYLEVFNKGDSRPIKVVWKRKGKVFHTATLNVGKSPKWRTWAYLTLSKGMKGPWTVEIQDGSGALLAGMPLIVQAPLRLASK